MREEELSDFSGGLKAGYAAPDFTDRQWSELFGVLFDGDRTLRAQWAIQNLLTDQVDSFWVWDSKVAYKTREPALANDGVTEVYWFGAGLPNDDSNDPLNFFVYSDVLFVWDDPVNGFWDAGFVWS